jgi:hypothetical protein
MKKANKTVRYIEGEGMMRARGEGVVGRKGKGRGRRAAGGFIFEARVVRARTDLRERVLAAPPRIARLTHRLRLLRE